MALSLNQFVKKWNKKYLDVDYFPKDQKFQCVDVSKAWQKNLGLPVTTGNAIEWPYNFHKQSYIWVKNKVNNKPKAGDLIVWNWGKYGHIALVISATLLRIKVFEQNVPIGKPCRVARHSYIRCRGWLRIRKLESR